MTVSAHRVSAGVPAGELARDPLLAVRLTRVAPDADLSRLVTHPRVQKSGLALAGHFHGVVRTRVQILGETELSFIETLSKEACERAVHDFFSRELSCVVITGNRSAPAVLARAAADTKTPLFLSDARSSRTINAVHAVLDERLAPNCQMHGVLVDVFGIGLLLLGKSGIGKSECALELVMRGHRLVADDIVRCEWRPPGVVFGQAADLLRNHIEIRGLGVLNVKDLFGVTSVRERKRVDIVVRLIEWGEHDEGDRLGLEQRTTNILGVPIRVLEIPVRPGRDMGSILEIAARNELLRRAGGDTTRDLLARIDGGIMNSKDMESVPPGVLPVPLAESAPPLMGVGAPQIRASTSGEDGTPRDSSAFVGRLQEDDE